MITPPWVECEQAALEQLRFTHGVQASLGQDWDYIACFRDNELAHGQFGFGIIGFRTGVRRAATAGLFFCSSSVPLSAAIALAIFERCSGGVCSRF